MATIISTKTSGVGGLSVTGDASGILQLASADGTTALTIDASQNVGIGVSNPSSYGILTAYSASNPTLTIASGNANAYLRLNTTSDLNMYLTNTGGSMTMNTANTERMRINSLGNVGIGTSSPNAKLDVNGTIAYTAQNVTTQTNYFNIGAAGTLGNATGSKMTFRRNYDNIELVTLDGSGNVGIGTSSPNKQLQIQYGSTNSGQLQITNNSTGTTATDGVLFGYDTSNDVIINNQEATATKLYTSGTERMRIDSTGATSFTGQVLAKHVDSSGYAFRATASSTGSNAIQFVSNANAEQAYLGSPTVNALVLRSTGGAATSYDQYWTNMNGMGLIVNKVTSSNTDIGDWPTPVLALKNYDGNFQGITMQTFAGRDDNAGYQTAAAVWNIRLWNDAGTTWTTSSANTRFTLSGPGILQMTSSTNGVQLTNGATSWAASSDENLKDIIEPITDALLKVSTLRTVIGKYKKEAEGIRRPFLIAQDVQKVLPEAVTVSIEMDAVDPDNIYAELKRKEHLLLSYTDLIPLLVASIKELKIIIDTQNARITTLEGG